MKQQVKKKFPRKLDAEAKAKALQRKGYHTKVELRPRTHYCAPYYVVICWK